jgi:GT2 family glycosyltransferase
MAKLTVSIVNYNTGDYLMRCLKSLDESDVSMEVWVVDNASVDDSVEKAKKKFPRVRFILNSENLGFGKAHKQVLEKLETEYVLILNPDVEFGKSIISDVIKYMEKNPEVGAATPKIVMSNGELDWAAHRGLPTPWASFKYFFLKDDSLYHLSQADFSKPHEVDAISGSFLLTRKDILKKTGLFDEDYFMYAEDIDLCYRIQRAGYKIMYLPELEVLHHKGISSGLKKHSQGETSATIETKKRSLNAFYKTMLIFYRKHLAQNYPFFINWAVYLAINVKWWLAKRKLVV